MSSLELTPEELTDALTRAELEVVGRMYYSSNATFLVHAKIDGLELAAVYKPRRGERPLWDFPEGTLCEREVAAYEVSRALGWDIVPITILRDGPLGEGAVQRFVEHDPDEHYFTLLDGREDRFLEFAFYDVLVNNTDRKGGHCLHDLVNDVVVGIDHGLTFHVAWKLRTVIWDFAGDPVPPLGGRRHLPRRHRPRRRSVARADRAAAGAGRDRSGAAPGACAARRRPPDPHRPPLDALAPGLNTGVRCRCARRCRSRRW